jgi:hypothetical protein
VELVVLSQTEALSELVVVALVVSDQVSLANHLVAVLLPNQHFLLKQELATR